MTTSSPTHTHIPLPFNCCRCCCCCCCCLSPQPHCALCSLWLTRCANLPFPPLLSLPPIVGLVCIADAHVGWRSFPRGSKHTVCRVSFAPPKCHQVRCLHSLTHSQTQTSAHVAIALCGLLFHAPLQLPMITSFTHTHTHKQIPATPPVSSARSLPHETQRLLVLGFVSVVQRAVATALPLSRPADSQDRDDAIALKSECTAALWALSQQAVALRVFKLTVRGVCPCPCLCVSCVCLCVCGVKRRRES